MSEFSAALLLLVLDFLMDFWFLLHWSFLMMDKDPTASRVQKEC